MSRAQLAALLLFAALAGRAGAEAGGVAEREINYLLDYVSASGCIFIRNGTEHAAEDASDHLRMKYRRGHRYAGTAEGFIENLASQSSWSGQPYEVVCEGEAEATRLWLQRALAAYRAAD